MRMIRHRSSLLSLSVLALLSLSASADAGVVVKWHEQPVAIESTVVADDLSSQVDGMSRAAEVPASKDESRQSPVPAQKMVDVAEGLAQPPGGAAPPSGAGISHAASACTAAFGLPAMAMPTCSFRYLRESIVQLPHPPLDGILDPPKTCA